MRIRRLDLVRYGKFTERSIDFGVRVAEGPDLHVVYGLNEAGKSTAFSAWLDLLFGIEERTKYSFLHPYAAMEIGACLEVGGVPHELVRRKQRSGSLVDRGGRVVDETLLAGALSGLGREAYRTMFSLDDDTLEKGGDAILQSEGELGELLFSANAGLAGVGAAIAQVQSRADGIWRKQARNSTEIAVLKSKLKELKEKRDAIDTAASAYSTLRLATARACEVYEEAIGESGRIGVRLDRVTRLARALPLSQEHAHLRRRLVEAGELPRPPSEWAKELPKLIESEARVRALADEASEGVRRLSTELEGIFVDDLLLTLSDEIGSLGEGVVHLVSAEDELPRSRAFLEAHDAVLLSLLASLGHQSHPDPGALIPSAAVIGRIRELMETRSGIEATVGTVDRAAAEAADQVAAARRDVERFGSASTVSAADLRMLRHVADRARRSDVAVARRQAERELARRDRLVAEAWRDLAPWSGDASALRSTDFPTMRRIEEWRTTATALKGRRAGHLERLREIGSLIDATNARVDMLRQAVGPIDDEEAHRLRDARETAWELHAAALDGASAVAFEAAMRADDRIVENRLARTANLADLRAESSVLDNHRRAARHEAELASEVETEIAALTREVGTALRGMLAPGSDGAVEASLDRMSEWIRRREAALAAATALSEATLEAEANRSEVENVRAALAGILARCGESVDGVALPDLLVAAEGVVLLQANQQAEHAAALRGLAECERLLATRQREQEKAVLNARDWERRWRETLDRAPVFTDPSIGAVRETLGVLDRLPAVLQRRDDMLRRIETMERDGRTFADRLASVLDRLGRTTDSVPPPQFVRGLVAELDRAERAAATRATLVTELGNARERSSAREIELRAFLARGVELTSFFGVETLAEVSLACAECAERDVIEIRSAEVCATIVSELEALTIEEALAELGTVDVETIRCELDELTARRDDAVRRRETLFADMTNKREALAAIGGDAAAARIDAERSTVLMHIEDAAVRFLRLRAGAMVAHEALRIYRDTHQSSMMVRASRAFTAMTCGEYEGLSTSSDRDRETLIGLVRNGGSRLAAEMSKGTRFQLYLALRMAGYEEFAEKRGAVPFVADDIMETFDEPRSREVLRLLAAMSLTGQVIYLTHHRHICDLATEIEPRVGIHLI